MNKTLSSVLPLILAACLFLSLQACGSQRPLAQSGQTPVIKAADRDYSIAPDDPSGFVVLTDVVPDVILEIRYYSSFNFVGARVDGYEEPIALMTKEAARALKDVSDEAMSLGYRLKIWDTYRPQIDRQGDHHRRQERRSGCNRQPASACPPPNGPQREHAEGKHRTCHQEGHRQGPGRL